LDLSPLGLVQQDLQSLTHHDEYIRLILWSQRRSRLATQKKTVNGKVKQVARSEAEHLQITIPPIVSPQVWALAQEWIGLNRTMARGFPATRFYLLKGLLACDCGRKVAGEASSPRCGGRYSGSS
jgi:hypothetical protein